MSNVTLYKYIDFGGTIINLSLGNYTTADLIANGAKANGSGSIKVPSGLKITFYQNDNYSGENLTIYEDLPRVYFGNWNNVWSSIKVLEHIQDICLNTLSSSDLSNLGSSIIYNQVRDAIVTLTVEICEKIYTGSGFFCKYGNNLYIITVAHLVIFNSRDVYASKILASISNLNNSGFNKMLECTVVGVAGQADIAVLSVSNMTMDISHNYLTFDDNLQTKIGSTCYIIGDPLGIDTISISSGLVRDNKYILINTIESLCVSAPVYKGNSGSPILNSQGKVIGIISYGIENIDSFSWGAGSSIIQSIISNIIDNNTNFIGKSIQARIFPVDANYLYNRGKTDFSLEGYYIYQTTDSELTSLSDIITQVNNNKLGLYYNQHTPTRDIYLNSDATVICNIINIDTGLSSTKNITLVPISVPSDIPLGTGNIIDASNNSLDLSGNTYGLNVKLIGPIEKNN